MNGGEPLNECMSVGYRVVDADHFPAEDADY